MESRETNNQRFQQSTGDPLNYLSNIIKQYIDGQSDPASTNHQSTEDQNDFRQSSVDELVSMLVNPSGLQQASQIQSTGHQNDFQEQLPHTMPIVEPLVLVIAYIVQGPKTKNLIKYDSKTNPGFGYIFRYANSYIDKSGSFIVRYRCKDCNNIQRTVMRKMGAGSKTGIEVPNVTVKDGMLISDPDRPRTPHFCVLRTISSIDAEIQCNESKKSINDIFALVNANTQPTSN